MKSLSGLQQFFHNAVSLLSAAKSDYHFSLRDYWMYFRFAECPGPGKKFPEVVSTGDDTPFERFTIGSFSYYWPKGSPLEMIPWLYQEVFEPARDNSHAYEYGGSRIGEGDIVIDAGSCEGFFTRYALGKGARVIAIEPVELLAAALEKTFSEEIKRNDVTVINAALGSATSTGYLLSNPERIFESHLDTAGTTVKIFPLDDLVSGKTDFIKMDIEGAEVEALQGAERIIREYKPRLSIAVYHAYENPQRIIDYLRTIRPDYIIVHRGICAYGNERPRPMMVYAW